jgi:hypothetical protein
MASLSNQHLYDQMRKGRDFGDLQPILELLLAAINDWPTEVDDFREYTAQVEDFLKVPLTQISIESAVLKNGSIDLRRFAWEAESLSQLVGVFDFYPEGVSLMEIMDKLELALANRERT